MTQRMDRDEYAVYLPAVNTLYAKALADGVPENRPFPSTLKIDDLIFWKDNNRYWYQPYFLHSAGQYAVGTTTDNIVTRRGRTDGVLFGDSGGFQIGKGTLVGFSELHKGMTAEDACQAWRYAVDVKTWIVGWLETHCNYAMTIDMPLWATLQSGADSPFHQCSLQELTELTVENLKFIDKHRQGKTKWLNVIQGYDTATMQDWWNAVKWFDGSGYALSSSSARIRGLGALLEPLLIMRDDDAFRNGRDWLHILGVSTPVWSIAFTALQRAIRKTVNQNFRISYDSSSPFQNAAIRELYSQIPAFGTDVKNWGFKLDEFPHAHKYVGSDEPLPFSSPIADQLTCGHLNVRNEGAEFSTRQVDTLSLALVANHNIWAMLESFKRANDLVFATNRQDVPQSFSDAIDFIEHVFTVDDWRAELEKEKTLLSVFRG